MNEPECFWSHYIDEKKSSTAPASGLGFGHSKIWSIPNPKPSSYTLAKSEVTVSCSAKNTSKVASEKKWCNYIRDIIGSVNVQ
jgi:hypothetical protein